MPVNSAAKKKLSARALSRLAMYAAVALILHYVEGLFPSPIPALPGVKLGLANIVVLFALYREGCYPALLIAVVRGILGPMLGGSVTGVIYALFGGIFALCGMSLVKKFACFSIFGASVAGAALHHVGQLTAASFFVGAAVFSYLPYMTLSAVGTGLVTALLCSALLSRIQAAR